MFTTVSYNIKASSFAGGGVVVNSLISSRNSLPIKQSKNGGFFYLGVAQLVECRSPKPMVEGSSPSPYANGSYHLFYLPEANSILKNNNNVETGTAYDPEVENGVKYSNVNPGNGEPSILAFDNLFNKHLNRTHLRGRMELCFA